MASLSKNGGHWRIKTSPLKTDDMRLFKKRKNKYEDNGTLNMSDKIAGKIANAGIKVQTSFANGMNKIVKNMGVKKLKSLLILFCLSAGGYSIYLFTNAIVSPEIKQPAFKIDQVDVPKHINKTADELIPEASVDEATFQKIQGFKKYMDSLRQEKSYLYDSINTVRPFLMDTVMMLEEIYYSQKQK
jgi:hypothetical protein